MLGRMIAAAMAFAALSTAASAATFYVNAATGNDTTGDGTLALPWATINRALTATSALAGADTIEVAAGTYTEALRIDDNTGGLTINGAPGAVIAPAINTVPAYTLDFPSGNQYPVIVIRRPNVTINGFEIRVLRGSGASANMGVLLHSSNTGLNPSGAVISNNVIRSFNMGGTNVWGVYSSNQSGLNHPVTIRGNRIVGNDDAAPNSLFARAIYFRQSRGQIGGPGANDGNELIGTTQDMLVQFTSGALLVENNTLRGPGMDFTEPNAGGATTIRGNQFLPASPMFPYPLLLKHNNGNAPFLIENNIFNGHGNQAIWVGAFRNTTIRNNTFTPAPGDNDFTHIRIDSAVPGTNVYTGAFDIAVTIQGNTFNPGTVNGGSAMRFYNDRKPNLAPANAPYFTGLVIGGAGALANTFEGGATTFDNYIRIEGANITTNYDENFDVTENLFRVSGGLKRPSTMTFPELAELHGKFFDTFDAGNTNAGYGRVRPNAIYLISGQSIARAESLSSAGHTIQLGAGIYAGGAATTKNLTVTGVDGWENTTVQGTGIGSAFEVATGTALTLSDVTLNNFAIGVDMNPVGASFTGAFLRFANLGTGINGRIGSSINASLSIFEASVARAVEPQGTPASLSLRNNVFGSRNVYYAQAFYGAPFSLPANAFDGNFYLNEFYRDDEPGFAGDGIVNTPVNITVTGSNQTVFDNAALAQYDGDADGLIDAFEGPLGGAVRNFDRDSDGVPDGFEVASGTNPNDNSSFPGGFDLDQDTDGDGYTDWYEVAFGKNPASAGVSPELGNVDPTSAGVQLGDAIRALQIINGSVTPFQGGANPHAINVTGAAQPVSLNNPLQILRFQNGSRISLPAVPGIN